MSVFIGRERDVTQLGEYLRDALQGKGKVVFIVGEAGIGKTRLIEEFKTRSLDAHNAAMQSQKTSKVSPDIRFAEAKCNELAGKGEAYAPFFEIIAQFVADDKAFGSSKLAEIVREVGSDWFELVPVIGKALSLISKTFFKWRKTDDVRQIADRQVQKEKLVQEFTHILKRMSDEHPLVLFLDDLHWADESSIALLFHIARHLQEQRILILGTYRPTDIEAARGDKAHPLKDVVYELHRYDLCATIKLGYLTKAHIRDFLDAYLGQHDLDAAFVDYLHDLTEGNPLFVTEYVKLLQEIGKLTLTPQTSEVSQTSEVLASEVLWTLRGTLRDADMPIPTSVEKVIEKRVERLKEELQKTLKYASVNGEQFNTLVLAKLLNWDEMELLEKLEALSRVHQLVKEITLAPGQTPRGAVYQFIHSLVQKSLYATLSAGIKSKLHAKAAEILEEVYHDDLETVAEELVEHYSRGQNHAHAAKYALLAARKANRQSGFQEARAHAQCGLEYLKTAGAKTTDQAMLRLQIELLIELATAEEAIGEAKDSIDHAETAAKLAEMVNDQSFQGDVFYQVGNLFIENRTTNLARILEILEQSLNAKIAIKESESFGKIVEKMQGICHNLGKGEYFIERCQEIIQLNQQMQKENLNIHILRFIATAFDADGKTQRAYDSVIEGLNITLKTESPNIQIELLECIVRYAIRLNNIAKAIEHYELGKNIANQVDDLEIKDFVFYNLAQMAWKVNKYEETFEYLRIAKEIAHKKGNLESEARILSYLVERYIALGKFDEAIHYGIERSQIQEKLGRVGEISKALGSLATTFRLQGNYAKCLEIRQKDIALARKYGRERTLSGALVMYRTELVYVGKFREAIEAINEAIRIDQRIQSKTGMPDSLMNLATCILYLGNIEEAISIASQAMSLNKSLFSKWLSIVIPMRYSEILLALGKYKDAYAILQPAVIEGLNREIMNGDMPVHWVNSVLLYLAFDEIDKALMRLYQIDEFLKNHYFAEAIALLKDAYAQVYLAQGDFAKAETSLNEAIALFQQMNSFRLGEADLTLAALRRAQNQPDAALQAAAEAHKIFQEIEYYRIGEAILWEAKSHLALRHFSETRACLAAANAIFTRQQQPHHAAEAKLVEGQLLLAELREQKTSNISETFEVSKRLFTEAQATFAELGLKRLENEAAQQIKDF